MKTAELKSEIEKLTSIQAERLDVPINEQLSVILE